MFEVPSGLDFGENAEQPASNFERATKATRLCRVVGPHAFGIAKQITELAKPQGWHSVPSLRRSLFGSVLIADGRPSRTARSAVPTATLAPNVGLWERTLSWGSCASRE